VRLLCILKTSLSLLEHAQSNLSSRRQQDIALQAAELHALHCILLTKSTRAINDVEMGGECGTSGGGENSNGLEVKPKGKIPLL